MMFKALQVGLKLRLRFMIGQANAGFSKDTLSAGSSSHLSSIQLLYRNPSMNMIC